MTVRVTEDGVYVDPQGWHDLIHGDATERMQAERLPGMDLALMAVESPVARVHLDLVAPGGHFAHVAWVSYDAVALLRDSSSGERRVLALPPDHLPAALARLTGIGPRRDRTHTPREVAQADVESWFGSDHAESVAALADKGADRAWTLGVAAADADPQQSLIAAAVDGSEGARLFSYDEHPLVLQPVQATTVWRVFTGILPSLPEN